MEKFGNPEDSFLGLPLELANYIVENLELGDLFACSAVCKAWRNLLSHDFLYVPHLIQRYNQETHGRDPVTHHSKKSVNTVQRLLENFAHLSATPYYTGAITLRELALRDLRLTRQWSSGVPTRKFILPPLCSRPPVSRIALDTVGMFLVTGDLSGKLVFSSTAGACAPVKALQLQPHAAISAMALRGDYLAVGTVDNSVHILQRDTETAPFGSCAFSLVKEFAVRAAPLSIVFEESVCIVGCLDGAVQFFDVGGDGPPKDLLLLQLDRAPGQNASLTLHYSKPFLFTTSSLVEQSYPRRPDPDNKRHLWEYDNIAVKTYLTECPPPPELAAAPCLLHPVGEGEILVAWPEQSVYRMRDFRMGVLHEPECEAVLDRDSTTGGMGRAVLAAGDRFFVTTSEDGGSVAVLYDAHTGRAVARFDSSSAHMYTQLEDIKMDPCFFVTASGNGVVVWDFTPSPSPQTWSAPQSLSPLSEAHSEYDDTPPFSTPTSPAAIDVSRKRLHSEDDDPTPAVQIKRLKGSQS